MHKKVSQYCSKYKLNYLIIKRYKKLKTIIKKFSFIK